MGSQVMVYVNADSRGETRKLVQAEIVKENKASLWVRLPDGKVVLRKRGRDIPAPEKEGGDGNIQ